MPDVPKKYCDTCGDKFDAAEIGPTGNCPSCEAMSDAYFRQLLIKQFRCVVSQWEHIASLMHRE